MARVIIACALAIAAVPVAVHAENREAYLERMRAICESGCMQPKALLRAARKLPPGDVPDMAAVIDIADVARRGDKYVLLQRTPNLYDMTELDFGMPHLDQSPISDRNNIVVEMDQATLFDLLNLPQPADGPAAVGRAAAPDDDIVVEAGRDRVFQRPSLAALKALFRNRRIVVRGQPRLDVLFVGARLDRRHKQLTLVLGNADDLALLPRYDDTGEPIFDGPLEGIGG